MDAYPFPTQCEAEGCHNLLAPREAGQPGRVRHFCARRCAQRAWEKTSPPRQPRKAPSRHCRLDMQQRPTRCQAEGCHNLLRPQRQANGRYRHFCSESCYNRTWRAQARTDSPAEALGPEVPLDGVPLEVRDAQRLARALALHEEEGLEVELVLERLGLTPEEWQRALHSRRAR